MQRQLELDLADSKGQNPLPGINSKKTPSGLGLERAARKIRLL